MFRGAYRKRRCLIATDGFYEWLALGKKHKQPYCFRSRADQPLAFAGIWERWHGPDGVIESCAILTIEANDLVRPVHDRMPHILKREVFTAWLDPSEQDPEHLEPLLKPFPASAMRAYPLEPWVNNVRHDDPRCLEPSQPTLFS